MKKLDVTIPTNYNATFFYALPTAVILAKPELTDWYNLHYVDLLGYKVSGNYQFRIPDAPSYIDRTLHATDVVQFDEQDLTNFEVKDIIQLIRTYINSEKYIVLYINEQFLSVSLFRSIHEVLVYGYDDDLQEVLVLGMDLHKKYSFRSIPYWEIKEAFSGYVMSDTKKKRIISFVAGEMTHAITASIKGTGFHLANGYNEKHLISKIHHYLNGTCSLGAVQLNEHANIFRNGDVVAGINTIQLLKKYTEGLCMGESSYNFNHPFFFWNHAKGMKEKLMYAYYKTNNELFGKASIQYSEVISIAEKIKNIFLKSYLVNGENAYLCKRDKDRLLANMNMYSENEFDILSNLCADYDAR